MSCGNRFECALRKNSRLSTQSDRPSNLELYNENQKRLSDLMKAREEIDNHFFRPISSGQLESQKVNTQTIDCLLQENITVDDVEINNSLTTHTTTNTFTPWVVPSTKNYSTN